MSNTLSFENVNKLFVDGEQQKVEVLKNLSFELPLEKTIAIIGASGSGKTTLLNILGGLEKPSSGIVKYNGENILNKDGDSLSQWRNEKVGFVFQFHQLLPDFSALENVMMPGIIQGGDEQSLKNRSLELFERIGLSDRTSHKPSQLSGGEQQRVAIARALINTPEFVLADEPTGNLDEENSQIINDLLVSICRESKATLVMVTHNMNMAKQLDVLWTLKNHVLEQGI